MLENRAVNEPGPQTSPPQQRRITDRATSGRGIFLEWIGVAVLLAALAAGAAAWSWLWRLDLSAYDVGLSLWSRPASEDIVLVAIDERSIETIGRWPWRRAVHATLMERLSQAGVKAVGVDIVLAEPDTADPGGDAALAAAIKRNGKAILPIFMEQAASGGVREIRPAPIFEQAAARLAHVHVEVDADSIARSVFLKEGPGEAKYSHFSLAMIQLAEPDRLPGIPGTRNLAPVRDASAWQRDYWFHIPFAGPAGQFRRVSYVDVLTGAVPASALSGKYVIIGATAAGLGDIFATAVSGHGRAMPGPEVSANVLDALRSGHSIGIAGTVTRAALSAALVVALLTSFLWLTPRLSLAASVVATAGLATASLLLLRAAGWWFPPAGALLGLILAYPVWSWRRLEATQRHIEAELARFAAEPDPIGERRGFRSRSGFAGDVIQQRIAAVRGATSRLRDTRRFIADTLNALPNAAIVTNVQLRVILANARVAPFLGLADGAPVIGEPLQRLLAGLQASARPDLDRLIELAPVSWEARHADGRELLVEVAPLTRAAGERRGLIVSVADISELKAAERKREEYLRFLSHDLRSPLASIVAVLDLQESFPEEPMPDANARIRRYVQRGLNLAEDFVQLARAEALTEDRLAEIDLVDILAAAADEAEALAARKGIRVVFDAAVESAPAMGVRDVMQRVFANLLSNAVKYSAANTTVTCSVSRSGDYWDCSVADQGQGIPAEDLPRLFDRFERLKAQGERKQESGSGLGLNFVKTAVEKQHGEMRVSSEPGKGSCFTVRMPASANF